MATKSTKKTLAPAAPPPPPTDEQIIEQFRSEAAREQAKYAELKERFLVRVANSPTDAIEWLGTAVIQQEAETAEWGWVAKIIEQERPAAEKIQAISDRVRDEQRRILDLRPWESNSTSSAANVANIYRTSGRARALERIGVHAKIAAERLRERAEVEADTETSS